MGRSSAVYIEAMPIGSELNVQLNDASSSVRRRFFVIPFGAESPHCGIHWPGSVDVYLKSIGEHTRKDLTKLRRKLFSDPTLKCEIKRFETADDLEAFFRDGIQVSDRTYQKRELGRGLALGGSVERTLRQAVKQGTFLGFIMYINEQPVAFRYGFVFGGTYVMMQTGYDPAWARHQVGSVLFIEVLQDLERHRVPVKYLDLMTHATVFKLRTTNDRHQARNYYLFKRNLIGFLQYASLKAATDATRLVEAILRKTGAIAKQGKGARQAHRGASIGARKA
jgi:hypothetical protein